MLGDFLAMLAHCLLAAAAGIIRYNSDCRARECTDRAEERSGHCLASTTTTTKILRNYQICLDLRLLFSPARPRPAPPPPPPPPGGAVDVHSSDICDARSTTLPGIVYFSCGTVNMQSKIETLRLHPGAARGTQSFGVNR